LTFESEKIIYAILGVRMVMWVHPAGWSRRVVLSFLSCGYDIEP
jgi:hypothetical protein